MSLSWHRLSAAVSSAMEEEAGSGASDDNELSCTSHRLDVERRELSGASTRMRATSREIPSRLAANSVRAQNKFESRYDASVRWLDSVRKFFFAFLRRSPADDTVTVPEELCCRRVSVTVGYQPKVHAD